MNTKDAIDLLRTHAGITFSECNLGMVGRFRPYTGLNESDFVEVLTAILQLHSEWMNSEFIEKAAISAIWEICDRSRVLMLDPQSQIRRNKLAPESELARLAYWVGAIEHLVGGTLRGLDLPYCMHRVIEYIIHRRYVDISNFIFIKDLVQTCAVCDDSDIASDASTALSILMA